MTKEEEKQFDEIVGSLLVSDISPDAGLPEIKAKCAEVASRQRTTVLHYLKRRKDLLDLERLEMSASRYYFGKVTESNKCASREERLNKDDKEKQIMSLVDKDEKRGTKNIYDEIEIIKNKTFMLETVLKNNKMIADRVENMLNAQINMDKIGGRHERTA